MQWTYKDHERPTGACYDCAVNYSEFPDVSVSDEIWELINPTEHEGAGLLCPTCIAKRIRTIMPSSEFNLEVA